MPQVAVLPVKWEKLAPVFKTNEEPALLSDLLAGITDRSESEKKTSSAEFAAKLAAAAPQDRRTMILDHVRDQLTATLGLDRSKPIDPKRKLADFGMDSLMAVELRNRLQSSLGISLPATVGFEYPTLEALSDYIATQLFGSEQKPQAMAAAASAEQSAAAEAAMMADIQKLSETELLASLAEELSGIIKEE
jgi:acyl carrier protein